MQGRGYPVAALGLVVWVLAAAPGRAETPPAPEPAKTGVHTLVLVRHGAYDEDDPADPDVGRHLVPLGRKQARLVGRRLAGLRAPIDGLYTSPMTRARETAAIVGGILRRTPEVLREVRECTPASPALRPADREPPEAAEACRRQLDAAFERLLAPTPGRDRTDVVVTHGNVIRSLVCRALGVAPEAWLGFAVIHTGVTVIEVRPDGSRKVVSFNDVGHLPPELQTRSGKVPLAGSKAGR